MKITLHNHWVTSLFQKPGRSTRFHFYAMTAVLPWKNKSALHFLVLVLFLQKEICSLNPFQLLDQRWNTGLFSSPSSSQLFQKILKAVSLPRLISQFTENKQNILGSILMLSLYIQFAKQSWYAWLYQLSKFSLPVPNTPISTC